MARGRLTDRVPFSTGGVSNFHPVLTGRLRPLFNSGECSVEALAAIGHRDFARPPNDSDHGLARLIAPDRLNTRNGVRDLEIGQACNVLATRRDKILSAQILIKPLENERRNLAPLSPVIMRALEARSLRSEPRLHAVFSVREHGAVPNASSTLDPASEVNSPLSTHAPLSPALFPGELASAIRAQSIVGRLWLGVAQSALGLTLALLTLPRAWERNRVEA